MTFLSVLEMVGINWAYPTSHLIADMGSEFEGKLGEFTEAHGILQHFTASEAAVTGKQLQGKQSKGVGARGFVEMRLAASMVDWAKMLACT